MNSYIQSFRFAATGRWAVSIRTYLLIFPFGYLVSVERELIFNEVTQARAAMIALTGELAGFLYLYLAQNLLLKERAMSLQPIWRCVFVWASTGVVRGLGVGLYAHWAFGYDLELIKRIPPAFGYTTTVMTLAAFYFGYIDRKKTELKAINSLDLLLAQDEVGLLAEHREQRLEAQRVLERDLLPQVQSLQSGIERALEKSEGSDSTANLNVLYEQSVKISQELERERNLLSGAAEKPSEFTPSGVSYWSAVTPKILSVRLTFILYSLGVVTGQFPRNGLEGVKAGLLGLVPFLALLIPFSQLIKKSKLPRSLLFGSAFGLTFATSYFYNLSHVSLGFDLTYPYIPWYSALKTVYGLYLASVIASLLVEVSRTRETATEQSLQSHEKIQNLADRSDAMARSIFEGRFGTLQGKISGVTMALHLIGSETMGKISNERKVELLKDANKLLGQSLSDIENLKVPR